MLNVNYENKTKHPRAVFSITIITSYIFVNDCCIAKLKVQIQCTHAHTFFSVLQLLEPCTYKVVLTTE